MAKKKKENSGCPLRVSLRWFAEFKIFYDADQEAAIILQVALGFKKFEFIEFLDLLLSSDPTEECCEAFGTSAPVAYGAVSDWDACYLELEGREGEEATKSTAACLIIPMVRCAPPPVDGEKLLHSIARLIPMVQANWRKDRVMKATRRTLELTPTVKNSVNVVTQALSDAWMPAVPKHRIPALGMTELALTTNGTEVVHVANSTSLPESSPIPLFRAANNVGMKRVFLSLEAAIGSLQRFLIDDACGQLGEDECAICFQGYAANLKDLAQLPCLHSFHYTCIAEWLERNSACPLCRKKVF